MNLPAPTTAELTATAGRYVEQSMSPGEGQPAAPQLLTAGAAGIALLHIERAHRGHGDWQLAHHWITRAVTGQVSAHDTTGLFLGVPAITFMLDAAATGTQRYRDALADVDRHVVALAHRRVDTAISRIRSGALPGFREYDVFFGLSGIGALLLRRDPGGSATGRVLDYLVALTVPRRIDGQTLPGWWVDHDPHRRYSPAYHGGHSNFGVAHGITGPLALLARAMRQGAVVDGQREAINTILDWLDIWRQDGDTGPWWPEWITLPELRGGQPHQPGPARPSWCYGTPGIARSGQLASITLGDEHRRQEYERAFDHCLADPVQQSRITDNGLCHGAAGLYQTTWRAAQDAATPALSGHLPRLAHNLIRHDDRRTGPGFLDGAAGTALTLNTAARDTTPISGWDACLLID